MSGLLNGMLLPQMPENAPKPLSPPFASGDPVPWFRAPSDRQPDVDFSTLAGRYVVLSFLGSLSIEPVAAVAKGFFDHANRFDGANALLAIVTIDLNDAQATATLGLDGVRLFFDFDRRISRIFGLVPDEHSISYAPTTYVLDHALRVVAVVPVTDPARHVDEVLALLSKQPQPSPAISAGLQAPVLMIPNVFERDFCKGLIAAYDDHGGADSYLVSEKDGRTISEINHSIKHRHDWAIDDERVVREIRARFQRRVLPEIHKAFQFNAVRIERFLVACYDARYGSHFQAHRDNATKALSHRRFSVSLNLNEDYEGGELVFPEYTTSLYRPEPGAAYVFSSSLLHEAKRITSGKRYTFLPSLYDDSAALVREKNARFLSESGAA